MGENRQQDRQRVLIAGGGAAALESALALRSLAGERFEVVLCAPRAELVLRPFAIGEHYSADGVVRYDLESLAARIGVSLRLGSVLSVDLEAHVVSLADGEQISYDYLLVASGARMLWAVPGAVTFWGAADEGGFAGLLRRLRAGMLRDVLFTIPSGTWGLRAYELALLSSAVLARSGIEDARLVVATPEDAPLELLGPTVGEQMEQLLAENRIEVIAGVDPVAFEGGRLRVVSGEPIQTEAVVSLPRLEGRHIDGLPADGAGFLPVDEHRRVLEAERVFAAGDVTAFPLKHGGIATQEAGVAAEAIAAAAGCAIEPASFDPVLRSVLWAGGGGPRYLYGRLAESHGDASELGTDRLWSEPEAGGAGHYSSPFLAALPDAERRGVPLD